MGIAFELKNGTTEGYCRICGNFGRFTLDHIPPKSCGNKNKVLVKINEYEFISQNGFCCKTICNKCNNELLGATLDKVFVQLYNRIKSFNASNLYVPNDLLRISIDAKKLLRCLLGHMLATNVLGRKPINKILQEKVESNFFLNNEYRKFVLGEIDKIDSVDIYYWY